MISGIEQGWPVVASVSGGKDSTAMCLYLKEQGIPYQAVHMDTGWEHPDTDRYIREVLEPAIGPIEWIVPPMGMVELIRHEGIFPSNIVRFCTRLLKVRPFFEWVEAAYGTRQIVSAQGIRRDESEPRSKLSQVEPCSYGTIWRPLLDWTVDDVIAIHHRHGLAPNPLYLRGASRVGCWPCINARKDEVRLLSDMDPGRIDFIRRMEQEITARRAEQGKGEATFFRGGHIDEMVRWSRTAHGGRQCDLFGSDEDRSGCTRWGMCDV